MSEFDPYHVWLGIAFDEQPADNYRLLGIRRFESNPDVIANAAHRQMAHLKTFQIGARANECQRLLNEVSAAAACLLDTQRKAAYDLSIQPPPALRPQVSAPKRRNRPQSSPVVWIIQVVLGGVLGMFVAVLTLNYFWGIDILGKAKKQQPVAANLEKSRVVPSREPIVGGSASHRAQPETIPVPRLTPTSPATQPIPPETKPMPVEPATVPPIASPGADLSIPPKPVTPDVSPVVPRTDTPSVPRTDVTPEIPQTPKGTPPAMPPDDSRKTAPPVTKSPDVPPTALPKKATGDVLAIYNTHNWTYGDRGAKICNIQLTLNAKEVWRNENVIVAWDAAKKANPKTTIELPDIKYDTVRIEVVKWEGAGGGLAEVQILRSGKNIALGKPAMANAVYNPESPHLCTPQMINDGFGDESMDEAGDGKGYWLLPSNKAGWIEIVVAPTPNLMKRRLPGRTK